MPRKPKARPREPEVQGNDRKEDSDLLTETGHVESPDVSASGDEETDGLNQRDEAVRAAVEDLPGGTRRRPDVPVFDRGDAANTEE